MHYNFGYTGASNLCEKPSKETTSYDKLVKCETCKDKLRVYRTHFPQGHPDKLEGGRR